MDWQMFKTGKFKDSQFNESNYLIYCVTVSNKRSIIIAIIIVGCLICRKALKKRYNIGGEGGGRLITGLGIRTLT